MKKINVAITITIPDQAPQSIWNNGGNQHAFFMYLMFKNMSCVANVWLISNVKRDEFGAAMLVDDFFDHIFHIDEKIEEVDLLVEMTAYVSKEHAMSVRNNGGRLVSYKFGNDFVLAAEACCFEAHKNWVPHPHYVAFDEVWTNAQHERTCLSFFRALYRTPVVVMPHVWSPYFLEQAQKKNERTAAGWPYRKRREKLRISIFEPNINVVKTTLIPFYAASMFFDRFPYAVDKIYMLNTIKLIENDLFKRIVMDTQVGRLGVAVADVRRPLVEFLGETGGLVLCHQWENALNYVYYEALCGGFPLVHNSPFLRDVGYYYDDFNIEAAASAIELAWRTHDDNLVEYREKADLFLAGIDPNSQSVVDAYEERVIALFC